MSSLHRFHCAEPQGGGGGGEGEGQKGEEEEEEEEGDLTEEEGSA